MNKKKYLPPRIKSVEFRTDAGFAASSPANIIEFEMILNGDTPAANSGKYNDHFTETDINSLW